MIRNHNDIVVAIITVIRLILVPAMYFLGSGSLKASTSSTMPSVLPLVQNENTQNHFVICDHNSRKHQNLPKLPVLLTHKLR